MRRARPIRISAATAAAVAVAAMGAQAAPAATGFERGDVLASVGDPSVIARFAADGTAKGTLDDSSGAGPLCFDATGEHLIAPGAGLYDITGLALESEWASVAIPVNGSCTVDASGDVFVGGGPTSGGSTTGRGTIRRFDLTGHLLHSYDVDATGDTSGRVVTSVDMAPDGCTIYYDLDGGDEIKRYDVCVDTQQDPFTSPGFRCDGVRVRPNGQVLVTCDTYGSLFDASGVWLHDFSNPTLNTSLRYAALDPDGSSFWMGEYGGVVARYDIATPGASLVSWRAGEGLHGLAVYSPPPLPPPPPPPPPPDTDTTNTETTSTESTNTETSLDPGAVQSAANTVAPATARPRPAVAAPAFVVARGSLITSGRSLLLDTGLSATCPARGPRCRATVALTVAAPGPRAAAVRTTPVGTLRTTIAPGARARLVVRLSRRGSALVRRRGSVLVAARATMRAGSGPARVAKTSVRVNLRRAR
jgi:hypothetical protein